MIKVACVGILTNKNNEVLLTKRGVSPFKNQYVMPGGKLDKGESVYNCVKREVQEEVGLEVIEAKLYDIYEVFLSYEQYLILYFICNAKELSPKIDNIEVIDIKWVNKKNFLNLNITEGTEYILSKFFKIENFNKKPFRDFRL